MSHGRQNSNFDIGAHLKALRRGKSLTLQQLSKQSGVSISSISKIENGRASASFDTLLNLCHALEVSFETLMGNTAPGASARRAITHRSDVATFETSQYGYEVHAQELASKRMIPLVMEIRNRVIDETTQWSEHPGEEFIYVVSGELDLHTNPYAPARLKAGESAYIDSGMPHVFVSVSKKDAKIISVCLDTATQTATTFVKLRTQS